MYFASRMQAGRMLASQLAKKHQHDECAILALNEGGVTVGAQIARQLKSVLMFLPTTEIILPRELEAIAGIAAGGALAYNHYFAESEIEEEISEYYSYIEQEKMTRMRQLNALMGKGGTVNKQLLKNRTIVLVADGLRSGFPLDLAVEFLKPIATKKLIVAVPFAGVPAVDRMHILADELYCLNVIEDYIDTDHYYDKADIPDHDTMIKTLSDELVHWPANKQTV